MSAYPRMYYSGHLESSSVFELQAEEAHHLLHVLRVKEGDLVIVFTGEKEFLAAAEKVFKDHLQLRVMEERTRPEKRYKIELIQAIPKSQKMDWVVEKATELGADVIYPVWTQRVVKKTERIDRWQKIALSAAKQCGRLSVPHISPVLSWPEFLKIQAPLSLSLIATLSDAPKKFLDEWLKDAEPFRAVRVAIGPEGDFTPSEVQAALNLNWKVADLGEWVLRSETAALAALSVLNHELGKMTRREKNK
jgi:16S rRNA (uracil1498-N3)-methyltransferase